ncbi:mitochondrial translocase, putative [Bodo saltans]|uniref:Mitochondrial import inner membrane translocase subunit n=1 Tax=Bodo saltans TaxID=75058 RepID=A0A0S4JRX4_BODSA|nr:mitochondrial translocase, putative [Bodo saltans]|eukprot:CUG94295.1 mitochondrial translocase, putative [Bodo saltans]
MPPRFSKAWNEEFDVMKQMQDDRMTMHNNIVCHERCVKNGYITNNHLLGEKTCMVNCLGKLLQTAIVTNLHFQKFEEEQARLAKSSKKRK